MKLNKRMTISAVAILVSCNVLAAESVIDLRHDYFDDGKINKDRIYFAHRFDNQFGFSVETRYKSSGDDANEPFNELDNNGSEATISYRFILNPKMYLIPAFNIDSNSGNTIYKPNLLLGTILGNGFYLNLRYRYDYTLQDNEDLNNKATGRYDAWLGYKTGDWKFEYNFVYLHANTDIYNESHADYEHDMKVAYSVTKNWAPYIEIGNVSVYRLQDDRQTRFRIGFQYTY
ncbi:porin [Citrobacter amalonaticus]|nr:porin [Citrobacter amalonaticus]